MKTQRAIHSLAAHAHTRIAEVCMKTGWVTRALVQRRHVSCYEYKRGEKERERESDERKGYSAGCDESKIA